MEQMIKNVEKLVANAKQIIAVCEKCQSKDFVPAFDIENKKQMIKCVDCGNRSDIKK